MTEITQASVSSVEISPKGITVKGDAYKDLQPVVRTTVDLADSVLRVINNVVGIPADFLNRHLGTFRKRLQGRIESISEEKRTNPPLRVGCAVMKEVAYAAEEPDIQKMFADLLATSCNTDTQAIAHPGFASVITQLSPLDAKILRSVARSQLGIPGTLKPVSLMGMRMLADRKRSGSTDFDLSTDNLVRLGLVEKHTVSQASTPIPFRPWQASAFAAVKPTTFGSQFVRACLFDFADESESEESNAEQPAGDTVRNPDTR